MRMVFEKFENDLLLRNDRVNVLRIEDPVLFSRCALSLVEGFPEGCPEPAYYFDENDREVKPSKVLFFAGDVLHLDLNDRRIVSQAIKVLVSRMVSDGDSASLAECINCSLEDVFEDQFLQMSADYCFSDEWDAAKYAKLLGFCIDDSENRTVFERLCHFLRVMADLFPDKVIAFVNLPVYLSNEQYNEFCELVSGLQLFVLSYEQGSFVDSRNFDNMLFIDANYLER